MKNSNLKNIFFAVTLLLLSSSRAFAHGEESSKSSNGLDLDKTQEMGHHALVHPFLAHMGMPDGPGETSVRVNAIQQRLDGVAAGTYGFHIETGIVDRLGLHLRNDGMSTRANSELMLQYALLRSKDGQSGLSFIGEWEFPTGATTETAQGLAGFSFAYVLAPVLAINSTIHYSFREQMTEWEISFLAPLTEKIFPIIEANGQVMKDGKSISNTLFGLKFKVPNGHAIGVGYQIANTTAREFDSQLILQTELNFE